MRAIHWAKTLPVCLIVLGFSACRQAGAPGPAAGDSATRPARASAEAFLLVLERGTCLGGCPLYTLSVSGDGAVQYEGKQNVRHMGLARDTIPVDTAAMLLREAEALSFFDLPDRYAYGQPGCGAYIADLPPLVLSLSRGGRSKRVEYDQGCQDAPPQLRELAAHIDRAAGSARWTGQEP